MFPVRRTLAILALSLFTIAAVACGSQSASPGEPSTPPDLAAAEPRQPSAAAQSPASAPAQPVPVPSRQRSGDVYSGDAPTNPTSVPEAMGQEAPAAPAEAEREVVLESQGSAQSGADGGPSGPAGPTGAAGAQGPAGPSGPAGPAGEAGARGPAGTHGAAGAAVPNQAAQPQASSHSGGPAPTAVPATASKGGPTGQPQPGATTFQDNRRIPAVSTREDAVSTFSLDTDRTSYRLALNWARQGYDVDPDSVRAEEWINSFNYDYSPPTGNDEFAIHTDVYRHPLDHHKYMARVGFQAPDLRDDSRPLNVTLVLDASGSMGDGNRIAIAHAAAEAIRDSLRDQDRIAVVQFTDTVIHRLTVEHTRPNDRDVGRSIDRLQPNGATNVQAGLDLGVELADEARRDRPEAYNYVILMSDGVANVDATNPFAILESAGDHRRRNPIRLVTIGVGIANYNDYLLEQLAQHGNGWYRYLDDVHQAQQTFSRHNWLNLATPFADQTRAQVTWNPEYVRSWRIVGYENRVTPDEFFTQDRKEFAEIPSGAATTVFYELELGTEMYSRSASTARLGDIELRWVEPDTGASREQYASLSGHWRQDFDAVVDPYLKLGSIIALAADRYSALPYPGHAGYGSLNRDLSDLNQILWTLKGDLGHLTAFSDFGFLLDHMTRYIPPQPPRPANSGYSP